MPFFRKINQFFLLFIKRFVTKFVYLVMNQEKGRFVEPPFYYFYAMFLIKLFNLFLWTYGPVTKFQVTIA